MHQRAAVGTRVSRSCARRSAAIASWRPAWRDPEPKADYDAVIVGGGGHGLATAYYLAKEHGLTNVAVVEKGLIGPGNVGRNTTHHPLQLPAARQHSRSTSGR